mgnify:CR=1 FL=1
MLDGSGPYSGKRFREDCGFAPCRARSPVLPDQALAGLDRLAYSDGRTVTWEHFRISVGSKRCPISQRAFQRREERAATDPLWEVDVRCKASVTHFVSTTLYQVSVSASATLPTLSYLYFVFVRASKRPSSLSCISQPCFCCLVL